MLGEVVTKSLKAIVSIKAQRAPCRYLGKGLGIPAVMGAVDLPLNVFWRSFNRDG